jgi:hypothetical protein
MINTINCYRIEQGIQIFFFVDRLTNRLQILNNTENTLAYYKYEEMIHNQLLDH